MIIIRINNRLGDQVLKYMGAFSLANVNKTEVGIDLFQSKKYGYFLSKLGFDPKIINIHRYSPIYKFVKSKSRKYDKNFFRLGNNIILNGIWYNYRYFERVKPILMEKVIKLDIDPEVVGVHIRRGDFVTLGNRIPCDVDYIKRGLNHFKGDKYIITTDDLEWCKENVLPLFDKATLQSSSSPVDDFLTLVSCKRLLISSSAFSWCAAYLSNAETVCPAKWLNSGDKYKTGTHHCPKEWKRL